MDNSISGLTFYLLSWFSRHIRSTIWSRSTILASFLSFSTSA